MRAREFIIEDNPDYDEDQYLKSDPGTPLNFPKGTTLVDVSDVYDWYKLGVAVSDLDDADPRTFNKGVPHTVFAFGSEEEEHKMIPLLKRLGFNLHDIDSSEDYEKAIRADEAIAHLEEVVQQQKVINDDELPDLPMPKDPGGDWTAQTDVDTGHNLARTQYSNRRGFNVGISADNPMGPVTSNSQRGVNIGYGPASLNIDDRGSIGGSYNIPLDDKSSVSLNASGQKDFGVTGVGAQYQRGNFSAGVNQPNFPGAKPQFNVGYSAKFEESKLEEMAGKVHGGVRKALMAKGYKYLGGGIDKQAYLEPGGQVLIVFGYRPGNTEDFSPDQRMFIDWINYCNANKNNPNLPRFSGFESFEFQGKNYIQARMEALQELTPDLRRIVHYIDQFTDQIGKRDFDQVFAKLGTDAEAIVRYLGGRQSAERLLKTVHTVDKFGRKHGYSLDLHSGNYMQRADGTIVVNDPFVHWMDQLGS
jgi:hypothetical protein